MCSFSRFFPPAKKILIRKKVDEWQKRVLWGIFYEEFSYMIGNFKEEPVHPKSNWKMWIKREWLQLGANFFWNFSRHPLLIWLHFIFHRYKTLKAVATVTAAIVLLTPANFYHFRRPKFNFQPLSFTFETFGKKLAETKIVARVNVKKIKANKLKKYFKSPAVKRQRFFTKICK